MLVELPRFPRAPAEVQWKLRQPSQANRSEFTGARRVTILAEAPRWSAQVKYPPIIGDRAIRPWRAALAMMQGRAGTFRLPAFEESQRAAYGGQSIQVDGAGQIGGTVNLRGFTHGAYLLIGWFITINDRLHQVVEQVIAGADGKMAVKVIPYVAGYGDGASVETNFPYALMSLTDDEAGWTVGPGQRYDIAFACEEAF
jgi:hypothetical protein